MVLRHPLVIDCAVVGVSDKLKGQMPLGLVVTKGEVSPDGGGDDHDGGGDDHDGGGDDHDGQPWWCFASILLQAPETLVSEIVSLVRKDLGAVAAFRLVAQVKALPRTRSTDDDVYGELWELRWGWQ